MACERFRTEADRQEFVAILTSRGYKPSPVTFSHLRVGTFRVYDRKFCDGRAAELRVSYFMSQPRVPAFIPQPSPERQKRGSGIPCSTPGHQERKAKRRGLCDNCYMQWLYYTNREVRRKAMKRGREQAKARRAGARERKSA